MPPATRRHHYHTPVMTRTSDKERDKRGIQEPRYILRCHSHATGSIFGETNSILSFASFFCSKFTTSDLKSTLMRLWYIYSGSFFSLA